MSLDRCLLSKMGMAISRRKCRRMLRLLITLRVRSLWEMFLSQSQRHRALMLKVAGAATSHRVLEDTSLRPTNLTSRTQNPRRRKKHPDPADE